MAKISSKSVDLTIGGVALEGFMRGGGLSIDQELPDVTTLSDAGPRVVVGNYSGALTLEGPADFASGGSDATIFADLGVAASVVSIEPTGATAAASDPNYDFSAALASYSFSWSVGSPIDYSASYTVTSAITRAVS